MEALETLRREIEEINSGLYNAFKDAETFGENVRRGKIVDLREATENGGKVFVALKMGRNLPESNCLALLEFSSEQRQIQFVEHNRGVLYSSEPKQELRIRAESRSLGQEVELSNLTRMINELWGKGKVIGEVKVRVPFENVGYRTLLADIPQSRVRPGERMSEAQRGFICSSLSENPGERFDLEVEGLNSEQRRKICGKTTTDDIIGGIWILSGVTEKSHNAVSLNYQQAAA